MDPDATSISPIFIFFSAISPPRNRDLRDLTPKSIPEEEGSAISISAQALSGDAEGRQGAPAALSAAGGGARLEDGDPREGEIVPDRILRAHRPECGGDLLRRPPVPGAARGEPHPPPEPRHVGVEGNDEVPGRRDRPEAEVHAVGSPDHPAQEQVVALARRPLRRVRKQEVPLPREPWAPRVAEPPQEPGETLPGPRLRRHSRAVRPFERPVLAEDR